MVEIPSPNQLPRVQSGKSLDPSLYFCVYSTVLGRDVGWRFLSVRHSHRETVGRLVQPGQPKLDLSEVNLAQLTMRCSVQLTKAFAQVLNVNGRSRDNPRYVQPPHDGNAVIHEELHWRKTGCVGGQLAAGSLDVNYERALADFFFFVLFLFICTTSG